MGQSSNSVTRFTFSYLNSQTREREREVHVFTVEEEEEEEEEENNRFGSNSSATMENNGSLISREKIDQVAMWLGSTVSSAFFSSLERFSCVNVTTSDPDDDDDYDDYSVSTTTTTTNNNPSVNGHTTNDVANLPV